MNPVFSPEGLLSRLVEQGPRPPGQLGWDIKPLQVLHNRSLHFCHGFCEPIRSAHRLDGKNSISWKKALLTWGLWTTKSARLLFLNQIHFRRGAHLTLRHLMYHRGIKTSSDSALLAASRIASPSEPSSFFEEGIADDSGRLCSFEAGLDLSAVLGNILALTSALVGSGRRGRRLTDEPGSNRMRLTL